ncbi:hypothetical protein N7492_005007 [Penicillium capsulatum]|uniref:Uncharacterized protein n=1 Tax=Penicillium capsulatum TaxID=69766 RepID=A0A9W9IAW2_9EURO|nr:hypothetical protein N7492_005007 [Penicillium capsulatum]KAJ6135886.1 hypothetical protein N7512_001046 [Penicillium capsulatum]
MAAAWTIQDWSEKHGNPSNSPRHLFVTDATNSPSALEPTPDTSVPNITPENRSPLNLKWTDNGIEVPVSSIPIGVLGKHLAGYPAQEISQLEQHGWIYSHINAAGNSRVYVVSRMTSRRQRVPKRLRAALKYIMSTVDSSIEAWEGERPPAPGSMYNAQESQDESLWYIFNTLDNPSPDVYVMKDQWSRRAMDELLSDEDFSDLGLKTRLYPYQRRSAATMIQREAEPAQMLDPRLQELRSPSGLVYYYDKEEGMVTGDKVMYSEACGGECRRLDTEFAQNLT